MVKVAGKEIIINPYEGCERTADWAWHLRNNGGAGGEDFSSGRKRTHIAAADGIAHFNGGKYGELTIALADGRIIRYAEVAKPIGKFPRPVKAFDPIGADALYRDPYYRDAHVNGISVGGTRIPFTKMVTHTQKAARIAIDASVLLVTERVILSNADANIRTKPTTSGQITGKAKAGVQIAPLGYVFGMPVNGNPLWYVMKLDSEGYPTHFLWSGGTTDTKPHNLSPIKERPTTTPTPDTVVVPPKVDPPVTVIVDPPKTEPVPPTETEPVPPVTDPVKVDPPKIEPEEVTVIPTPALDPDASKLDNFFDKVVALLTFSAPKEVRRKVYEITSNIGVVGALIGAVALALAPVLGGETGSIIATIGASVTLISGAITSFASKLAKNNT